MATIVHYEVYVQDARGWTLQSRYPEDEREKAIFEAKTLEASLNKPVRVNREVYDSRTNHAEDHPAYVGYIRPKPMPLPRPGMPGRQPGMMGNYGRVAAYERAAGGAPAFQSQAKAGSSTTDFAVRIILVMIGALAVAVIGTALGSLLLGKMGLMGRFDASQQSTLAFGMFLALFLITAVPLVMTYVPLESIFGGGTRRPPPPKATPTAPTAPPPPPPTRPEEIVETALSANQQDSRPTLPPSAAGSAVSASSKPAAAALDPLLDGEPSPAPAPSPAESAPEPEAPPPAGQALPPDAALQAKERTQVVMMGFLNAVVNALKVTHPHLDAYNKFGVNLYLAGACDALLPPGSMPDAERAALLREAVEVIGTRPEQARHLVERLEGYKKQNRYAHMIAAGRLAMEVHLSGNTDPFIALGGVMKDWNTPQARQVAASTVTILFTDMVGSTDMTQSLGDAAAQDVIRAHNTIVRAALAANNGKEVKHTGDGIMASFDDPGDALRCGVEIQQRVRDHNTRWHRLPLALRIGMNTGEPIIEENDYFGATVQIAARVCAAAERDQVWLSGATLSAAGGAGAYPVHDHGGQMLKGVREPVALYEVLWDPDREAEVAAGSAFDDSLVDAALASVEEDTLPAASRPGPQGA